jgi:hypothetical protein
VIGLGQRALAVILVFAMQLSSFASTGGMLRVSGDVTVDNVNVPGSMAVSQGQLVKTGASSNATFDIGMTKIFVSPNTVFKYVNPQQIALWQGRLFVDTSEQVRTNVGTCGLVLPTSNANSGATKYEIQVQGKAALVYARELPITVRADMKEINLPPQTMAVIDHFDTPNCTVAMYSNELTPAMKMLLAGSATAAVAVGVGIGRHTISASHP